MQSTVADVWFSDVGYVLTILFNGNPAVRIAYDNESLEVGEMIDSIFSDESKTVTNLRWDRYYYKGDEKLLWLVAAYGYMS